MHGWIVDGLVWVGMVVGGWVGAVGAVTGGLVGAEGHR